MAASAQGGARVSYENEGTDVIIEFESVDGEIVQVSIPAERWLEISRVANLNRITVGAILKQGIFDYLFQDIVERDPLA